MSGWHAKRFEFEPEWDNDAEAAIAEIEFKETDTPEEEAAKLQLLAIYNKRLDEVITHKCMAVVARYAFCVWWLHQILC